MPKERYIKSVVKVIFIALLIIISAVSTSHSATLNSYSECREYDEVYYEKVDDYFLPKINLRKLDHNSKLPSSLSSGPKEFSPQATKHYIIQSPDFMKQGPWNTEIYVIGNRAKPVKLKITFSDHGNGGVRAKWLNEKLLFIQVWWGRIVSTDLILDVDTSKWIYLQNANYGNLIIPCDEKMKNR